MVIPSINLREIAQNIGTWDLIFYTFKNTCFDFDWSGLKIITAITWL